MAHLAGLEGGEEERGADVFVVELAALLHDIADYKLNKGNDIIGPRKVGALLLSIGVNPETAGKVAGIISEMNFPGTTRAKNPRMSLIEGEIVRDADFLDAMGAVGIARTFAYGGSKGRPIYEPSVKPKLKMTQAEYRRRGASHTINHFHEKLLRLKDILRTREAKRLAAGRQKVMESFLEEFYFEWDGKK